MGGGGASRRERPSANEINSATGGPEMPSEVVTTAMLHSNLILKKTKQTSNTKAKLKIFYLFTYLASSRDSFVFVLGIRTTGNRHGLLMRTPSPSSTGVSWLQDWRSSSSSRCVLCVWGLSAAVSCLWGTTDIYQSHRVIFVKHGHLRLKIAFAGGSWPRLAAAQWCFFVVVTFICFFYCTV